MNYVSWKSRYKNENGPENLHVVSKEVMPFSYNNFASSKSESNTSSLGPN